jgi:hypothetical protein
MPEPAFGLSGEGAREPDLARPEPVLA